MGIRITNKMMTNNALYNVNTNKTLLDQVSTQVATKQKITRASEDPVVAIRALRLKSSISALNQYKSKNIPDAESWLNATNTALDNMYKCASDMKGKTTGISTNQYSLDQKKALLEEFQKLREQIYEEGNVDISGRSILTGYKTNMDLAFKTADTTAHYKITESFSGTDVDAFEYVSGCVEVNTSDILATSDTEYDQNTIKNNSLYRLRLSYNELTEIPAEGLKYESSGKLSADLTIAMPGSTTGYVKATVDTTGTVSVMGTPISGSYTTSVAGNTVTISDGSGNTTTFDYAVNGNTVTASKTIAITPVSLADAGGSDAAYTGTAAAGITLIKETGELILGAGVHQSLQDCGDDAISFTYEKTGFAKNELKPEHYFDCTNLANGYEYKNLNESENIEYIVNFNQTLSVNTEGKNVFDQSIGRDVDDLISALNNAIAADTKKEKIKSMLTDSQYSGKTEYIKSLLDACEKESTYAENKLQNLAKQSITNFSGYCDDFSVAKTETGSKISRLTLTKERATTQLTNLTTLSQENIGIELSDVLIEQSEANLAYDAALSATSKIITHSLLDFL